MIPTRRLRKQLVKEFESVKESYSAVQPDAPWRPILSNSVLLCTKCVAGKLSM
jgi:hypothetical protein